MLLYIHALKKPAVIFFKKKTTKTTYEAAAGFMYIIYTAVHIYVLNDLTFKLNYT